MNKQHICPQYICPQCQGFGIIFDWDDCYRQKCDFCRGKGIVSDRQRLWRVRGEYMRDMRVKKGWTLREAGKVLGIDASYLSKMERGCLSPKNIYLELTY